MGKWLNTKTVLHPDLEKPCIKLGYCPYGQLVEEFPIRPDGENTRLSCSLENGAIIQFGHDCPVHYHAEMAEGSRGEPRKVSKIRSKVYPVIIEVRVPTRFYWSEERFDGIEFGPFPNGMTRWESRLIHRCLDAIADPDIVPKLRKRRGSIPKPFKDAFRKGENQ